MAELREHALVIGEVTLTSDLIDRLSVAEHIERYLEGTAPVCLPRSPLPGTARLLQLTAGCEVVTLAVFTDLC